MSSVPKNKEELQQSISVAFKKILADYSTIPPQISREIGVIGNVKGTEISVSDTISYLIGWGKLVLKWYDLKSKNQPVDFPETGYKWNELRFKGAESLILEFNRSRSQCLRLPYRLY